MRSIVLVILLLAQGYAQVKYEVTITPDTKSTFFDEVDNPFNVHIKDVPSENIIVKIDCGLIEGKDGSYLVKLHNPCDEKEVKVEIGRKDTNGKYQIVKRLTYKVRNLPGATAYFADKTFHKTKLRPLQRIYITVEQAKSQTTIEANFLHPFPFEVEFIVSHFQMFFWPTRDQIEMEGNTLSPSMLKHLQTVKVGDFITFGSIRYKTPYGTEYSTGYLSVKIVGPEWKGD